MHRPGIEPGPPAWQASILPLNHRCFKKWPYLGIHSIPDYSGNRTRAARVAGEHSTTELPMLFPSPSFLSPLNHIKVSSLLMVSARDELSPSMEESIQSIICLG
ncbi:hypothetical protein LAZ67_15003263, partial [Cordylochernes scorpioides]